MSKKKLKDRPQKIKTTEQELEILANLSISTEWIVLKRVMQRYATHLRSFAFNLSYFMSPEEFKLKHREATAQVLGFKRLVKLVEKSGSKLDKD
jgi:hypothetical protein